jgi:amino acid adenylation domain-containing protein
MGKSDQRSFLGHELLLRLDASSSDQLRMRKERLQEWMSGRADAGVAELAHYLEGSLSNGVHRLAFSCSSLSEGADLLKRASVKRVFESVASDPPPPVVFMFSGQGGQYAGMSRTLYEREPVFRETLECCAAALEGQLEHSLIDLLFPSYTNLERSQRLLKRSVYSIPAIWSVDFALAKWWMSRGVMPDALVGHSIGEYVCWMLSGGCQMEEGMILLGRLGEWMGSLPRGGMLSVFMDEVTLRSRLPEGLYLSGINSPKLSVVSGPLELVRDFHAQMRKERILCEVLDSSMAFHCPLVEALAAPLRQHIAGMKLSVPTIPIVSSATGQWMSDEEALSPDFWAAHFMRPIQFRQAVETLWQADPNRILLEVGPGQLCSSMAHHTGRSLGIQGRRTLFSLAPEGGRAEAEWRTLMDAAGQLWGAGIEIDYAVAPVALDEASDLDALFSEKVDRTGGEVGAAVIQQPTTATERLLAAIWCDVLALDAVGVNEDFFELGGHSLLGFLMLNQAQEAGLAIEPAHLFQHHTIEALARAVEEAGTSPVQIVRREELIDEFPLSHTEERFWYLSQYADGGAVFNIAAGVTVFGELDLDLLQRCIAQIVERHDVLRSYYVEREAGPRRCVFREAVVPLERVDARGDSEALSQRRLQDAGALFDLKKGPLWKVCLYQTDELEYQVVFVMHHIIADGWSFCLVIQELQALYAAGEAGREARLPELPVRYGDFAAWQREAFSAQESGRLMDYWRDRLSGVPVLELPTDFRRPPVQRHRGAKYIFRVPGTIEASMGLLCRAEGITPFMLLMTGYIMLLSRFSGQTDFAVGTPVANRPSKKVERLAGLFMNNVALRCSFDRSQPIRQLLALVKREVFAAFAHQELPFEKVVEGLTGMRHDSSRTPVYQVMLSLNSFEIPEKRLGTLQLEGCVQDSGRSQTDLWVGFSQEEDGLIGFAEYDVELFRPETIEAMMSHYVALLEQICRNPDCRIDQAELFSPALRKRVLECWNETAAAYPRDACVDQLIDRQVVERGDATALLFGDVAISYNDLQRRATTLALVLVQRGVKRGDRVGVCLPRGPEWIIAELAIWKAGGAYVPLDPIYPADRLRYMVEDSGARFVLVQGEVPWSDEVVSCLQLEALERESAEAAILPSGRSSDDMAYLIYTSGSTGKPKGVPILHRSFVNFLLAMKERPGFTASDTLLAITTPCFDIAGLEFFLPLIAGGRVAILTREQTLDGDALAAQIETVGTVLQATPSTWRMLLESGWKGASHLKMLCGGEGWPRDLACAMLQGGGELWNMYGPTETTVWSSVEPVSATDSGALSIGRPIANTQFYILDAAMQPVPVGVPGSLWIGGDGLSPGYYHRDDLSEKVFRDNPFMEGGRLYNSGDLARWLPDGRVECLGRQDFQLKIRGFRIEPEEIEKVMVQFEGVEQAVVHAVGTDELKLVGYYRTGSAPVSQDGLKSWLKQSLPDYMIPSGFMELDAFPLTQNGKVDRKRLPDPGRLMVAGDGYMAPRNEDEMRVAAIWAQVLGVERVGVRDDFFELGGHSLQAIRLIKQLGEEGYSLQVNELFLEPTVEAVVHATGRDAANENREAISPCLVQLKAGREGQTPLFFVHTAPGDILIYANLIHELPEEQPCYGLQSLGLCDDGSAHATIEEMAAHYVWELKRFYPEGPYQLAGWCFGGTVAYEMARQLKLAGCEVKLLAVFDLTARYPYDVELKKHFRRTRIQAFIRLPIREKLGVIRSRFEGRFHILRLHKRFIRRELVVHVERGMLSRREEVYARNLKAGNVYKYRPYAGRLELFRPEKLNVIDLSDTSMGWEGLVESVGVSTIPGDHRSMLHMPGVRVLSRLLTEKMQQADS